MNNNISSNHPLLRVENLRTYFHTADGVGKAVDGVSFQINKGETLGLVGESGCGKSITSLSIMRLLPSPPFRILEGQVHFAGWDLLTLSESEMRSIRGERIAMIFQEPMTALNPVFTVGEQIAEVYRLHRPYSRREAFDAAVAMMKKVKIPAAQQRAREYPHQLSGGMRQRVMIAMALACDPDLLIADEPTTALDVTIQAQILDLMEDLKERIGTSILLITHDLGVVAEMANQVAVMYAGHIVEYAPVSQLFADPLHPYTQGLLRAIPSMTDQTQTRLNVIPGMVPAPTHFPSGCRFHPRCEHRFSPCDTKSCEMLQPTPHQKVRCFLYDQRYKTVTLESS